MANPVLRSRYCQVFILCAAVCCSTSVWCGLPPRPSEGKHGAPASQADGAPGITKPVEAGRPTLTGGDPVMAGSGEFRQKWRLLSLGGFFDLGFTLQYAPNLQYVSPYNDGFTQFPPSLNNVAFSSDAVVRIVEFEEGNGTGVTCPTCPVYVNVFVADDALVFREDGAGELVPVGPDKHQLKKVGGAYFLLDVVREMVFVFRSRPFPWPNMGTQFIRRSGEATHVLDRHGNSLTYAFDSDNKPVRIEDGLGRRLDFTYLDRPGRNDRHLESVTDGYGRKVMFQYEQLPPPFTCHLGMSTVLASFTDASGGVTSFEYFDPGEAHWCNLVKRVVRPSGNSHIDQSWAKNPVGQYAVQAQKDAYGNRTGLAFAPPSGGAMTATFAHPDGGERSFTHLRNRYPLEIIDEAGAAATVAYTGDERPSEVVDRAGGRTALTYHAPSGKISTATNSAGGGISFTYEAREQAFSHPDDAGLSATFVFYDISRVDYPDGTSRLYTYNDRGDALTLVDRAGQKWTFEYNPAGRMTRATNPAGGSTVAEYGPDGTVTSTADSDTGTTTFTYDLYKRLSEVKHPDGGTWKTGYDIQDRPVSTTDGAGRVTVLEYDANGNLSSVTDPAGHASAFGYDLMDRFASAGNRVGGSTSLSYDSRDRLSRVADPTGIEIALGYDARGWANRNTVGGRAWETEYDAEGVVAGQTAPSGRKTSFKTDSLGAMTGVADPMGHVRTVQRDAMGLVSSVTDQLGMTTRYSYTGSGELASVTMPSGASASYGYDAMGLLDLVADLNGAQWRLSHTPMGRKSGVTDPLGRTRSWAYDQLGRVRATSHPDGLSDTATYDGAGNATRVQYGGGPDIQYAYDSLDNLVSTDGVSLQRNAEGWVTSTVDGGVAFGAGYDAAGRLTSASYAGGAFAVSYTYSPQTGQLSGVTDSLTGTRVDASYDEDGRMAALAFSNGERVEYSWDDAGRLVRIRSGDHVDIEYSLDAAGRVTGSAMTAPLTPESSAVDEAAAVAYDAASQIGSAGYSYDPRGRMTAAPGHSFAWDGASRLTSADGAALAYNGTGDLRVRTAAGKSTRFYYNYAFGLASPVAERDEASGAFLRHYVRTPSGRLLYMIDAADGNRVLFYHFDRVGSTLALTDGGRKVTDAYAYDPFGKLLGRTGNQAQPFTFAGAWGVRQEGGAGELYHMGSRFYDAAAGRFLSPEPAWPVTGDPAMLNPYQYAKNDPVRLADPTGSLPKEPLDPSLFENVDDLNVYSSEFDVLRQVECGPELNELWSFSDEPPPPPPLPGPAQAFLDGLDDRRRSVRGEGRDLLREYEQKVDDLEKGLDLIKRETSKKYSLPVPGSESWDEMWESTHKEVDWFQSLIAPAWAKERRNSKERIEGFCNFWKKVIGPLERQLDRDLLRLKRDYVPRIRKLAREAREIADDCDYWNNFARIGPAPAAARALFWAGRRETPQKIIITTLGE